ncbi:MAG: response regulator [Candidatus Hodarchaeales archaeon]
MNKNLHILIIEDIAEDSELMERGLCKEKITFTSKRVGTKEAFIKELKDFVPDIVLIDYKLPQFDGITALRLMKKHAPSIPAIIVTGQLSDEQAVECIKAGAVDYILKDRLARLGSAVKEALEKKKIREEREEIEKELRETTRLNQLFLDSLPHPAMLIQRNRTIIATNRVAKKLGAKVGGCCWRDFAHSDYIPDDIKRSINENRKNIHPIVTKCTFCRMDEAFLKNKPINDPEINAHGKFWDTWWIPIGNDLFLEYFIDITERKQAEERVKHLNLVLRSIRGINQLITREKDREHILQGACDILIGNRGYYSAWIALIDESGELMMSAEAGLGGDFSPLIEKLKRGDLTECGRRAVSQQGVVVIKNPHATCTDCPLSEKCREKAAMTIRLEYGGKVYGMLSVSIPVNLTDSEEEKSLFEEVAGDIASSLHNIELEDEQNRMAKMLIQSEKMASIGTLAAGVAHEINNPVGFINSNLETLNKYLKNLSTYVQEVNKEIGKLKGMDEGAVGILYKRLETLRENLKVDFLLKDAQCAIQESIEGIERVGKIVGDLKDFSRMDKYESKPADINEILEKSLNLIWNELKYKAKVIKNLGDLPLVYCDIQRISQVFVNILLNAVQAIEKQGTITIKTFQADSSVAIQISDSGEGIPEKNKEKIFDAFFTTKSAGKGTGLGLSIVYRIIKDHNGTITLKSSEGMGTTFTITLPTQKAVKVEHKKILIVDDEEMDRESLTKMIMTSFPFATIQEAADGFKAAVSLDEFQPDIVLLDIRMPGIDGIEVCRRVKKKYESGEMKVIIMSGFLDDALRESALAAGADAVLEKPITGKALEPFMK